MALDLLNYGIKTSSSRTEHRLILNSTDNRILPVVCTNNYGFQPLCSNGVIYRINGLGTACSINLKTTAAIATSDLGNYACINSTSWTTAGGGSFPWFCPNMASNTFELIKLSSDAISSKLSLNVGTAKSTTTPYFYISSTNLTSLYNAGWRTLIYSFDAIINKSVTGSIGIEPSLMFDYGRTADDTRTNRTGITLTNTAYPNTTYNVTLTNNYHVWPFLKSARLGLIDINTWKSMGLYISVPGVVVKGSQSAAVTVRISAMNIGIGLTKETMN